MATLSALPAQPRSWAALLERDDIVLDQGVLRLRHELTTPAEARVEDLLLTANALQSAGIAVLLVRHDVRIPALVIDLEDAAAAVAALRELPEPVYVKRKARPAMLAAELAVPPSAPASIRVYRPRISAHGELRYNHEVGIRVEFWRFGEQLIEAPHENALTRRLTPTSDVELHRRGALRPTLADALGHCSTFIQRSSPRTSTWCSRGSTARRRVPASARRAAGGATSWARATTPTARYRQIDELKLRAAQRAHVRPVGPPHLHRDRLPRPGVARSSTRGSRSCAARSSSPTRPCCRPTTRTPSRRSCTTSTGSPSTSSTRTTTCSSGDPVEPELFFSPAGITKFVECGDANRPRRLDTPPQRARQRRCE